MQITFKILIICFLLFSCNQQTKHQSESIIEDEIKKSTNNIIIKFTDLTISINDIEMSWEDDSNVLDNIYETKKDTAFFNLFPGDFMFEKTFNIEQIDFDEIELYGQYEIKVGIESKQEIEVPFCVLENWKSYTSEWVKFKINERDLKFPIIEEKNVDPIIFTVDELKLAVERHCGANWLNEIKSIKSIDKLPTSFFITKYIYKLKARNSKTNERIEKLLVFYTPTSC